MKHREYLYWLVLLLPSLLLGCKDKEVVRGLDLGIDPVYTVERLRPLSVVCYVEGGRYSWRLLHYKGEGEERDYDSVVGTEQGCVLFQVQEGVYGYQFDYWGEMGHLTRHFDLYVSKEGQSYSPYAVDVLDYSPAPGQLVNVLPAMPRESTLEERLYRCRKAICGKPKGQSVTLGGFGGNITLGFDHVVVNVPGEPDFCIYSDVQENRPPENPEPGKHYCNSEPGVVMVAFDRNANGRPDEDEWYEIQGEVPDDQLVRKYEITYYYPTSTPPIETDSSQARNFENPNYIRWEDNQGGSGYIPRLRGGSGNIYWPRWEQGQMALTFRGTLLPKNGSEKWYLEEGIGTKKLKENTVQWALPDGYVDNLPSQGGQKFDIGRAVDAQGNPVHLPGIHFIRVYTGVNVQLGWTGEFSTEVSGAADLHMLE